MSAISSISSRVTNLLTADMQLQSIDSTEAQLNQSEAQLSTGEAVSVASDNPGAAALVMTLNQTLSATTQYTSNINTATSSLQTVDGSLGSLSSLLLQAQSLASANVSTTVGQSSRASAATTIQSMIDEAMSIGNTNTDGSYIFGGDKDNSPPFVSTPNGVQFVGSTNVLQNTVAPDLNIATQVNGARVFGSNAAILQGSDLAPAVTASTRLSDLAGANGSGITPGQITLSNGTTTATIDLTHADTMGDVVADINAAAVGGITASLTPTGIKLTGAATDNITVADDGGNIAQQTGIATSPQGAGAGVSVNGSTADPTLSDVTSLSSLIGGAGLDLSGLTISNGTTTKTVSLAGASNVQDLLDAINGTDLGVTAKINSSGTGIELQNTTQGSSISVGENGGNTARELGFQTFSASTPLSSLNDGAGITPATGGDFTIDRTNGTSFSVSLAGATTVQNVINDINTADAGGGVTASFSNATNSIVLTDSSGGSGTLSVTATNGSNAASALGLDTTANGATLTGTDPNALSASGVFADLQSLMTALQTNNTAGITAAAQNLQTDYNRVVRVRADAGSIVDELQTRTTDIQTQTTATQSLISQTQDVDFATAISNFQQLQTSLEASLQVVARSQQDSLMDYLST